MEVGVLFDEHEAVALRLERLLRDEGFVTALNAPYSARAGLAHAAQTHGHAHDVVYVELEIRQDLIPTPHDAARVAARLVAALSRLGVRRVRRS